MGRWGMMCIGRVRGWRGGRRARKKRIPQVTRVGAPLRYASGAFLL